MAHSHHVIYVFILQCIFSPLKFPWLALEISKLYFKYHPFSDTRKRFFSSALSDASSENSNIHPKKTNKILINRWGGYPILHHDALSWANRIRQADGRELLTDKAEDSGYIFFTLKPIVQAAGGVACYPHNGPTEPGKPHASFLILTQHEEGEWRVIDGTLEPGSYLVEGEREAIAKELLKREGKP